MKFSLPRSLQQQNKELYKIHVGPEACVGKRESNIFFAKCRESRIKKVRKVEKHKNWVRGRFLFFFYKSLDGFRDFQEKKFLDAGC